MTSPHRGVILASLTVLASSATGQIDELAAAIEEGNNHFNSANYIRACESFRRSLDLLERRAHDWTTKLSSLTALAMAQSAAGRCVPAASTLREAVELAARNGETDGELTGRLRIALAAELISMGRPRDAEELLWRVLESDAVGRSGLLKCQFLHALAGLAATYRRYEQAELLAAAAERELRNGAPDDAVARVPPTLLAFRANLAARLGRMVRSRELFERASEAFEKDGMRNRASYLALLADRVDSLVLRGDLEQAQSVAARSTPWSSATPRVPEAAADAMLHLARARLAALQGDAKIACQHMERAEAALPPTDQRSVWLTIRWLDAAGYVHRVGGDAARAMRCFAEANQLASEMGVPSGMDAALRTWASAKLRLGAGELEPALERAGEAMRALLLLVDAKDTRIREIIRGTRTWAARAVDRDAAELWSRHIRGTRVGQGIEPDSESLDDKYRESVSRGADRLRARDLTKARHELTSAVELRCQEPTARKLRALCLERLGEYDEAARDADMAVRTAQVDADSYRLLSKIEARRGAYSRSASAAHWARMLEPDDPRSLVLIAVAKTALGEHRAAIGMFEAANELRRGSAAERVLFARALLGAGELSKADSMLMEVHRQSPNASREAVLLGLAEIDRRRGNHDAARAHCAALLREAPNSVAGNMMAAWLAWQGGDGKAALERVNGLCERQADSPSPSLLMLRWFLAWTASKSEAPENQLRISVEAYNGDESGSWEWQLCRLLARGEESSEELRQRVVRRAREDNVHSECRAKLFEALWLARWGHRDAARASLDGLLEDSRFRASFDYTAARRVRETLLQD